MTAAKGEPPHEGDPTMVHPCPRKHSQESLAVTGSVLCAACISQTVRNLRVLPGLYQECLHHVSPTYRRTNPTRVSGSRRQDYLNISVLDARRNILATLESWSEIVVEKLRVPVPARSVPQLTSFLTRHLEWLAAQPPAADFADEVESLVAELRGTIDPDPGELRTLMRRCVADGCDGMISAVPGGGGGAVGSAIECSAGHSWEMHEWLNLRLLMERQRKGVSA
ncbi:hypothetical protein [Streptomyces aquilus]|uniref:hypothetical protein n=1 Tax=Streptomyces aquilus TaxID=2548456 RepID=UPI0036A4D69C